MKILFVTGILSPFWIEFQNIYNSTDNDLFIFHSDDKLRNRGSHWAKIDYDSKYARFCNGKKLNVNLKAMIDEIQPDILIYGGMHRKHIYQFLFTYLKNFSEIPLINIDEQPFPSRNVIKKIKNAEYSLRFGLVKHALVLAIGDRAANYYKNVVPKHTNVKEFRYFQDLKINKKKIPKDDKVRFVFSGQLIPRNNIGLICEVIKQLYYKHGEKFTFEFAAIGPEQARLDELLDDIPNLKRQIRQTKAFRSWNDRLKPFQRSDVLVLPAEYSGWGLVVPEALSHGVAVITNQNVEAARFYVRDGVNGFMVSNNCDEIVQTCSLFIDDMSMLKAFEENARRAAGYGDVEFGVELFSRYLVELQCP